MLIRLAFFMLRIALAWCIVSLTSARAASTISKFSSVSVAATNFQSEAVVTNGLTLGGVRNTSWPAGGIVGTVSNNVASAGLLSVDATKTNGIAATSNHVIAALGYTPSAAPTQLTLTHAGTLTLDFTPRQTEAMLNSITGAITFATSNLGASNSFVIFGRNTQATNCAPTFPSWQWMGGAPSTITAQKAFVISLQSRGTVDTNVWAAYAETP